jgi:peptide chain release factor 3
MAGGVLRIKRHDGHSALNAYFCSVVFNPFMSYIQEISRRKTFAIISHPDAGKTTLTEKFLLFGGAIQTAGAVKSNKIKKTATSDFMEIEKQRGISVATSVMGFEYNGLKINILDTPGHKDFAEDTYRTLTAVDSVILVVDCVKGVEEQTEKLMEVCRMRNTPVIIFVNKMDREGKDPFDLLDELEEKLRINVRPLTWPISQGSTFKGIYNLFEKNLNLFSINKTKIADDIVQIDDLNSSELDARVEKRHADKLREDVELIEGVYEPFEPSPYLDGSLAPVFFGSAINNFGVKELLEIFCKIAPAPRPRETNARMVDPLEKAFTGFVFKIHANLDPNHRDRIAFLRICSGKFERNTFYYHTRLGKKMKFANPTSFMANEKSLVEESYPGDVVGLYDSGNFKIGDTLTEGEPLAYQGIPSFSPELFRELVNKDPFKSKQLEKGISQLTEEGVAQLFVQQPGNKKIIGTVGPLQFDVIQFRLEHEYGAKADFYSLNYFKACWITSDNKEKLDELIRKRSQYIAYDKDNNPVYMAESQWLLNTVRENYPEVEFHFTSEFKNKPVESK